MVSNWQIQQAARVVRNGGVIAYPTEAVWGLGCDPWNDEAVERLLALKDRPVLKDYISVLRTGCTANWGSFKDEKDWVKAMEDETFANHFTAAMDCRGVYLGAAVARSSAF